MSITLHAELEQLTKLGEISDSKDAACDPFSSQSPFPIDSRLFFDGEPQINTTREFEPFTPKSKTFKNLTGQRFGRWTVFSIYCQFGRGVTAWLVRCDCGNWGVVSSGSLANGHSQSCGCLNAEMAGARCYIHGGTGTPEHNSYMGAKERCTSVTSEKYPNYGGRGIEFRFESFEQFLAEVGTKPSPRHSLDRIDVNGHYEIGNVRWATPKQQANNTRRNRFVTYQGETLSISQWSRKLNISRAVLDSRLKSGMDMDEAIKELQPEATAKDFHSAIEIADALIAGTPVGEEIIDFSKPILRPTTGQQVSDCCGAYDRDTGDNDSSFSDFGFCPECRDHCTFIDEEEEEA